MTRDEFREQVLQRDGHRCVLCGQPAQDAHHVIDRSLWSDGGYHLCNGVSVCESCHLKCEATDVSVEELRQAAGIMEILLPDHLEPDQKYDKWGNPVLPNGTRLRGELFQNENVQKILKDKLSLFLPYVKYPRTYHLPWTQTIGKDDKRLPDVANFLGKEVVVTEKMDGENTSAYGDYIHARSLDGADHPSQHWVKRFWGNIGYNLPKEWRVCGENLFAKHSIHYHNLRSFFYGFSVWNEVNVCLSWDETLEWFELLGITSVPVLYRGLFDEEHIKSLWTGRLDMEGYVVRLAGEFHYASFRKSVAKFVRKNHVVTDNHWKHQALIRNECK